MRTYSVIHKGEKILYTLAQQHPQHPTMTIPSVIPRFFDPLILYAETTTKMLKDSNIRSITVQDEHRKTWFKVRTEKPIPKLVEEAREWYNRHY